MLSPIVEFEVNFTILFVVPETVTLVPLLPEVPLDPLDPIVPLVPLDPEVPEVPLSGEISTPLKVNTLAVLLDNAKNTGLDTSP